MTTVSPAAIDAFRQAEDATWKAAAPITQGEAVEVNRDAVRAGLEAAAPLLAAEVLERVHLQVRAALGANTAREREARDAGRDGDALLNAARADAFDWVLQRLDEAMGR
jgi:hypothetical protein